MGENSSGEERAQAAGTETPEDVSPAGRNIAIPVNAEIAADVLSSEGVSAAPEADRSE